MSRYSVTRALISGISTTCSLSRPTSLAPARSPPHPSHAAGSLGASRRSGSAESSRPRPSCPTWPPRTRAEPPASRSACRCLFCFAAAARRSAREPGPSEPGGFDEFDESFANRAASSPTNASNCSIRAACAAITASSPSYEGCEPAAEVTPRTYRIVSPRHRRSQDPVAGYHETSPRPRP